MPKEIERKFLVKNDNWRSGDPGVYIRQGYLHIGSGRSVRIRLAGKSAFLTVKGRLKGIIRNEYEYGIPLQDGEEMLTGLCIQPVISKHRYKIWVGALEWVVDEFHGANQGLVMAEVELVHEYQALEIPEWAGKEVTTDSRYYNANLVGNPFKNWGK